MNEDDRLHKEKILQVLLNNMIRVEARQKEEAKIQIKRVVPNHCKM